MAINVALFLSGSGSNALKIIENSLNYEVKMIFSDNINSNAKMIGAQFGIDTIVNDKKDFYKNRDLADMKIRKEFDSKTKDELKKRKIDLIALCGYMSLITEEIYENFPTINLHPADLTYKNRKFAGLMGVHCVISALNEGLKGTRSTIHVVSKDADMGKIIAISKLLPFINGVYEIKDSKSKIIIAKYHLELQKRECEWKMYPKIIEMIANGTINLKNGVTINGKMLKEAIEL